MNPDNDQTTASSPFAPAPGLGAPPPGGPAPVPSPEPTLAPVGRRRRFDVVSVLLAFAVLVAAAGVAFAVGRVTAPQVAARSGGLGGNGGQFSGNGGQFPGNGNGNGNGNAFGGRGLGGASLSVRGTVVAVTATQLTIKLASGTTIDIPISAQTTWHRQAAATPSDAPSGTTVLVELQSGNGGGQASPNPSGAPGPAGRLGGPASDITIVAP